MSKTVFVVISTQIRQAVLKHVDLPLWESRFGTCSGTSNRLRSSPFQTLLQSESVCHTVAGLPYKDCWCISDSDCECQFHLVTPVE